MTSRTADLAGQGQNLMTAKVMDVKGGTATLDLDGRTVEVRTDLPLKPGAEYKVMVKGFRGNNVQLQVVSDSSTATSSRASVSTSAGARPLTNAEISSRLVGFDLPEHQSQTQIARGLIQSGVPVTRDNMMAMMQALPQNAAERDIAFMANLARQGVEPQRELLQLMPILEREIQNLPQNIKTAMEQFARDPAAAEALNRLAQLAAQSQDARADQSAQALRNMLLAPGTDSASSMADKLQNIGRQFLTVSESRLMFLDAFQPATAQGAEPVEQFARQLGELLSAMPRDPGAGTQNLEQALNRFMEFAAKAPETPAPADTQAAAPPPPEPGTFEAVRQEFMDRIQEFLNMRMSDDQVFGLRSDAEKALAALAKLLADAPSAQDKALLPEKLLMLPGHLENILSLLEEFGAQTQGAEVAPALTQADSSGLLARMVQDLAPLLTMRFNSELFQNTSQFIETANQAVQDQGQGQDVSARIQMLAQQAANPAMRQELELLLAQLRNAGDLRSALSQLAQNTVGQDASNAALNMARSVHFATVANLVAHNGAVPTQSFVTFFPIQLEDHVEIGKLKVYRNLEGQDRKGGRGGGKEMDPENASVVIILDTDFLGMSRISINTHERRLRCNIEVQNKRLKKVLDKYLDELRDGLKNTPFEFEDVGVTVLRRRAAGKKQAQKAAEELKISTIDMKI